MQRSCKRGLCIFYLTFPGLSGILCKIPNDESEKPQCIYFKIQPVCGRLSKDRMGDDISLQTNRHQHRRLSETEIIQTGKHMEKNYKLIIGYDGTRYFGWEHQPGKDTIQGKLEDVLNHLAEEPVLIIGAGRTDAGVHARAMVANVVLSVDMTAEQLRDYMNRYLPDDIIVQEVREASMRFHARYNAIGKTYCYTVFDGKTKPLFDRKYVWQLEKPVNIERMQKAAEYLIGEHDFMSFCKNPQKKKSLSGDPHPARHLQRVHRHEGRGVLHRRRHLRPPLQARLRLWPPRGARGRARLGGHGARPRRGRLGGRPQARAQDLHRDHRAPDGA